MSVEPRRRRIVAVRSRRAQRDARLSHDCGPPLATSLAFATWALFLGLALLLVGVGLFSTLVGVRSELNGYSDPMIGAIAGAYYAGFLVGSKLTLGGLARVGHIRVYAALASLLSATMIVVGLTDSSVVWLLVRFASGAFIGGQYVVAESWLNQLATNQNRGRLLGIYLVITGGAYGVGQVLIGSVDPLRLTGFAVAALLTSVAVAPVALSEDAVPPPIEDSAKVSLRALARQVPTGVGSGFLVGLIHGAFRSLAAVYATRAGLSAGQIGPFVAITAVGGVAFQWPLSTASDELDRRFVGAVVSLGAVAASVLLLVAGPHGWKGLVAMLLIGGNSLPLYSIAAAYTSDWVDPEHVNAASSHMVTLYGAGALVGPPAVSLVMQTVGTDGYVWSLIVLHALMVAFLVYRMIAWRAPIAKLPWSEASLSTHAFFLPANVVWMGRLTRRGKE